MTISTYRPFCVKKRIDFNGCRSQVRAFSPLETGPVTAAKPLGGSDMQKIHSTWQRFWRGRRRLSERRRFFYSACIPERRARRERRSGIERRDLLHRPPDWRNNVGLTA
jgi:hypothetical protein